LPDNSRENYGARLTTEHKGAEIDLYISQMIVSAPRYTTHFRFDVNKPPLTLKHGGLAVHGCDDDMSAFFAKIAHKLMILKN